MKPSMPTIAERLADFVIRTRYEDIDEKTLWRAKMCTLDMLGVIMAAWPQQSTQILYRLLRRYGGRRESTVLGSGKKLPAAHTALMHSAMAHSLELEDHHSHKHSLNHPGVCTIPPALAIAERERMSGMDFLTAVVLGYEIGSRISAAARLGVLNLERGFHESSLCGPFSAATVAGKLMGLNAAHLVQAYGICGSLASGSMEFKKSEALSKRFQIGNASRNGVMAVELASAGLTGPPTVFEGKHGFYHSYVHEGNYDLSSLADGFGKHWAINQIQYKPFACAGVLHSAVTAAQKIRMSPGLDPLRIQRIIIGTASKVIEEYASPAHKKAAPDNPVGAQFSLQYSVAVMMVRGRALLEEFTPAAILDPEIMRIASLVEPQADPAIDAGWPRTDPTEITVVLDEGRKFHTRVEEAKGDLSNPVTDEELLVKFTALVAPFLPSGEADRVIHLCGNLEKVSDINELIKLLNTHR